MRVNDCQIANLFNSVGDSMCEKPGTVKYRGEWLCEDHYEFVRRFFEGKTLTNARP